MRRKQSIVPSLFPRIGRRLRKNGRIIYFLLFCPLLVHSGIDSLKETWETNHRAQKLYDSPLGGVYRIRQPERKTGIREAADARSVKILFRG